MSSSKCPCPAVKSENVLFQFIALGNFVFYHLYHLNISKELGKSTFHEVTIFLSILGGFRRSEYVNCHSRLLNKMEPNKQPCLSLVNFSFEFKLNGTPIITR